MDFPILQQQANVPLENLVTCPVTSCRCRFDKAIIEWKLTRYGRTGRCPHCGTKILVVHFAKDQKGRPLGKAV